MISGNLSSLITNHSRRHEPDSELNNNDRQKKVLEIIRNEMSSEERKENNLNLETGEPSWLTTLPIKEAGYILNKQSFWICYPSNMDGD